MTRIRQAFSRSMMLSTAIVVLVATIGGCAATPMEIHEAWARPAPVGGHTAVYMTIVNQSGESDSLVSVEADVAGHVSIHETIRHNDVMAMQPLDDGLSLPPRQETVLEPGGLHIMLMDIEQTLEVGDTFELTLTFANSGSQKVVVPVQQQAPAR